MKLNVKHDTSEREVIINGVECDFCGQKEHKDFIVTSPYFDQAICEACYDNLND